MKAKNKKGIFGFFKNMKRTTEPEQPDTETSDNLSEDSSESETPGEQEAASDQDDSTKTPAPDTMKAKPKLPLIWESVEDPLIVRIDEELLHIECNQFISKMRSLASVIKRTAVTNEEQLPKASQPHIYISKNFMAAWIYVIPPVNDGQDVTLEDIKNLLESEHVTTGILEDALSSIVENHIYDQAVLVAKGTLPRNGVDGSITDHYKRVLQLEFEEDEKGSVDYKNLNNIQSIKEGEAICEITLAIPGEDGLTVTGKPYPCETKGTDIPVPSGRNTELTEDRTQLISQVTGHVSFINSKFQVDPVLKINGDIDNSTGNLDYDGSIMISGDVRNGFSVKATGSIQVKGSVEGAEITAKGPITIASGMSGNGHGILTSNSDIKCRYLEHCTVRSKGSVYAESIINSNVESNQDIDVTKGMGAIIGGSLLAANNIYAKVIGSKVRRLVTELTIASVPKNVAEETQLNKELKQHQHNFSEVKKNINYLESAKREDKQELLDNLRQVYDYLDARVSEITERLQEINGESTEQAGIIQCQQLLPVVRIRFGSSNILVKEEYSSSIIYKNSDNEIIIGNN